jgi:hypothetical protein
MKSWWWGRFIVKLKNGWFFESGERFLTPIKEDDLVEYSESKDGIVAALPYLEGMEQEWLEKEYANRKFKQTGENEWQQL